MALALALALALAERTNFIVCGLLLDVTFCHSLNLINMIMRNFRDYDIWKSAIALSVSIYSLSNLFPSSEKFGLTNQIRRAVVSIGSNIAEGASRKSEKDFCRYLEISVGSSFEVETQLIIANEVGFVERKDIEPIIESLHLFQRQTHNLINILEGRGN